MEQSCDGRRHEIIDLMWSVYSGALNHMSKIRMSFYILLFCISELTGFGQNSPITVDIKPEQTAVEGNETFLVSSVLRNTSKENQVLKIWSCSYSWQWTADDLAVHVNEASCKKNTISHIELKPGEVYQRAVSVQIKQFGVGNSHSESVTFRLGYEDASQVKQVRPSSETSPVWSNPITVSVTPHPSLTK